MTEIEGVPTGSVVVGVVPRTAEHVVRTAAQLAARYGVALVVVAVEPDQLLFAEGLDGSALGYPVVADDDRPVFDGDLARRLTPLAAEAGVPVRFVAASGQPATVLSALADRVDAAFVVVGSREAGLRGSVREFFAGSVAVHLTHHQHRPVVVVPLEPAPHDERLPWEPEA